MPTTLSRTITHPQLGQMILLDGISGQTIETLIQAESLRCILHKGHRYVVRGELAGYCPAGVEDAIDLDSIVEIDDQAIPEPLQIAIRAQTVIDEQIPASRSRLVRNVLGALRNPPTQHIFAHALRWPEIWASAAHIALNTASEFEAIRIAEAYHNVTVEPGSGLIDEAAFTVFHRTLLSLAAPELDPYFLQIWQAGYGLLIISQEPGAHAAVLNVLRRLVSLFSGYRGVPEGSDTPVQVMADYLRLVRLSDCA